MAPISVVVLALTIAVTVWIVRDSKHHPAPVYEIAVKMIPTGAAPSSDPVLFLARSDGGKIRNLNARSGSPIWSPDGRLLANAQRGQRKEPGIYVLSLNGKHSKRLTNRGRVLSWSPLGDVVLTLQGGEKLRKCDSDVGSPCFAPERYSLVRIRDGRSWSLFERSEFLDGTRWMPDGTLLISGIRTKSGKTSVYAVRPDKSIRKLTPIGSDFGAPQISRDGRTIVVWGQRRPGSRYGLWLLDLSSGKLKRNRNSDTVYFEKGLSPDGRWLAFDCQGICVADVENGRTHRLSDFSTAPFDGYLTDISWSPNSRMVAAIVRMDDDDSGQIVVAAANGSEYHHLPADARYLMPDYVSSFSWSPDSREVAYVGGQWYTGFLPQETLWVIRADGKGPPIPVAGSGEAEIRDFAWCPVPLRE